MSREWIAASVAFDDIRMDSPAISTVHTPTLVPGVGSETAVDEPGLSIAVLLPCRNESQTIGTVVAEFRRALPHAVIYVYDNASTDGTDVAAREAGAVVRYVPNPGKGNVLRRMFAEVEAAVYVLADGDDTYDPFAAPELIHTLRSRHLDMVVGRRVTEDGDVYRRGHRLGNRLLASSVGCLFGADSCDLLSGYRVLSRRYVKTFPAASRGFETETEMTLHSLNLSLPFDEIPTKYRQRPEGSTSKLRTVPDGFRILAFILLVLKDYRPFRLFGSLSAIAMVVAAVSRWGPQADSTGGPNVTLALCLVSAFLLLAGVVLDSMSRSRRDMMRVLYLAVAAHAGQAVVVTAHASQALRSAHEPRVGDDPEAA